MNTNNDPGNGKENIFRSSVLFYISRACFTLTMKLLLKVRVFGKENFPEPPFIITSNHASLMDPPMVGLACSEYPVDFMAKRELFDAPVIGQWTRRVRCIPVDRGRNSVRGMKEALRRLKRRHVVAVFPEGTRSIDGSLQEGKIGTGFLIAKAKVPVVPVYVYGSQVAFPKGKGVRIGTPTGAMVGRPIMPEEFPADAGGDKEGYERITDFVMGRIGELKEEYEEKYGPRAEKRP